MKILVTGGAGFIGSNLVRHLIESGVAREVVNLDALTYAGNLENLAGLEDHPAHRFVHGDIRDRPLVTELMGEVDALIHAAAESHVDRSIDSAAPFIRTNVEGTQILLETALEVGIGRFVHVSTDEVYGSLPWRDPDGDGPDAPSSAGDRGAAGFTESSPITPRSPYAASKAASDHMVSAYHHTHGLDTVVIRASNNYGPYQFPEKLIPLMITHAREGRPLPVYGDGLNVRDWIHVSDHCRALVAALENGRGGEVYNVGGRSERTNLSVIRAILTHLDRPEELIRFVSDRPGHDRRYAIDPSKAERELGWRAEVTFEDGLTGTVDWYLDNEGWWRRILSGEYRDYHERMYGGGGRHAVARREDL